MIRKVLTAALIAAFTLGTTPGFACTGISLKAGDGAAIRGHARIRLSHAVQGAGDPPRQGDERHAA
jgi:hypothetical protein